MAAAQFTETVNPRPIPGQGNHRPADDLDDLNSSDEERTHISVISRRLRKRRKTNSTLVSNPFGSVPSSDHSPSKALLGLEDNDDLDDEGAEHVPRRRKSVSVPESDKVARQRCYDYLHTAIDAVWAEYCDSTSYAETMKYMPHSPVSEHEDSMFLSSGEDDNPIKAGMARKSHHRSDSISLQPQSQSLMRQKKRLLDAKYYLSHFVGAADPHSSGTFWRVWDQLKYTVVELVEGDEDEADEVLDDLELGRHYYQ